MKHLITEFFSYKKEKQFQTSFRKLLGLRMEIINKIFLTDNDKKILVSELDKVLDKLITRKI